jgi:hypothetical protein
MLEKLQKQIRQTRNKQAVLRLLLDIEAPLAILKIKAPSVSGELWLAKGSYFCFGCLYADSKSPLLDMTRLLEPEEAAYSVVFTDQEPPVCECISLKGLLADEDAVESSTDGLDSKSGAEQALQTALPEKIQELIKQTRNKQAVLRLLLDIEVPLIVLKIKTPSVSGELWLAKGSYFCFGRVYSDSKGPKLDMVRLLEQEEAEFSIEATDQKPPVGERISLAVLIDEEDAVEHSTDGLDSFRFQLEQPKSFMRTIDEVDGRIQLTDPHVQPMGTPAHSIDAVQPMGTPAHSIDAVQPMGTPAQSTDTPAQSTGTPAHSIDAVQPMGTPAHSMDNYFTGMGTPVRSMDSYLQSMGTPKQSMDTQVQPKGTPAHSTNAIQSMGTPAYSMDVVQSMDSHVQDIIAQSRSMDADKHTMNTQWKEDEPASDTVADAMPASNPSVESQEEQPVEKPKVFISPFMVEAAGAVRAQSVDKLLPLEEEPDTLNLLRRMSTQGPGGEDQVADEAPRKPIPPKVIVACVACVVTLPLWFYVIWHYADERTQEDVEQREQAALMAESALERKSMVKEPWEPFRFPADQPENGLEPQGGSGNVGRGSESADSNGAAVEYKWKKPAVSPTAMSPQDTADAQRLIELAKQFEASGDFERASDVYVGAVGHYPYFVQLRVLAIRALIKAKRNRTAKSICLAGMDCAPSESEFNTLRDLLKEIG